MIALLCSVLPEAELLISKTIIRQRLIAGSKTIIAGKIADHDVVICPGGMGKANAAHAATLLVTRYDPEAFIIFGIGGAYPSSRAKPGDIAVAREEIAGDEGVETHDGFKDTQYIGIPLLRKGGSEFYNRFSAREALLRRSLDALASWPDSPTVHQGPFVTLSTCTGTSARARELGERYRALCENMEGAAAVHVAELHDVPWLEIRGISNIVEDRDTKKWNIAGAAEAAQRAVIRVLERWVH